MKKLLLSLGAITSAVAPVAAVVACGEKEKPNTQPAHIQAKMMYAKYFKGEAAHTIWSTDAQNHPIMNPDAVTMHKINELRANLINEFKSFEKKIVNLGTVKTFGAVIHPLTNTGDFDVATWIVKDSGVKSEHETTFTVKSLTDKIDALLNKDASGNLSSLSTDERAQALWGMRITIRLIAETLI